MPSVWRHVKAELNPGQGNSRGDTGRQDIEPDTLDKGVVHTGDLIFPWHEGIRQDARLAASRKHAILLYPGDRQRLPVSFQREMKSCLMNFMLSMSFSSFFSVFFTGEYQLNMGYV